MPPEPADPVYEYQQGDGYIDLVTTHWDGEVTRERAYIIDGWNRVDEDGVLLDQ